MDDKLNKFQQYFQQNRVLIGILSVIQIIIIVLVAFIIKNLVEGPSQIPTIPIFSLSSEIKDLPDTSVQPIEKALHDVVILNNDIVFDVNKSDTKIRENTLVNRYFEKQNIHYINFIVDIPSLEQSYQIFHEWTDDYTNPHYLINRATIAMCIPEEIAVYSDFDCEDDYGNSGQKIITSEFIGYINNDYFTASMMQGDSDTIQIYPVNYEINEATKNSYIEQAKEDVSSLGILPDIFTYKVMDKNNIDYTIPINE